MKIKKEIFFMIFLATMVSFAALAQTITSDSVPAPVMQAFFLFNPAGADRP